MEAARPHPLASPGLQVVTGIATAPVLVGLVCQLAQGGPAAPALGVLAALCMALTATTARLVPHGLRSRSLSRSAQSGACGTALVLAVVLAVDAGAGAGAQEAVAGGAAAFVALLLAILALL